MSTERPILTARWSDLLVLNFPVPVELMARQAPPGTEPDLYDGQAYVSIVGFQFHDTRLLGARIPGHVSFLEINLRYYVRRFEADGLRRGVVFVREIVPRYAISTTANWLFHENYVTRPMRGRLRPAGRPLSEGDVLEYAWASRRPQRPWRRGLRRNEPHWNRFAARVATPPSLPPAGSLDEFIIEHYWGYVRGRDEKTREYRVMHVPWRTAPVDALVWDCDVADTYGAGWAEHLARPPTSALVAEGSAVEVFRGRRLHSTSTRTGPV